ncbi:hypothetical protein ACIQB5_31130 [Streptomyces sp. NPDC088560]|uniref:hypothetical protein n=1 Tax=Streptomyces sp. NPDC088560 TaxID=3365868 RepID=UPI0038112E9A
MTEGRPRAATIVMSDATTTDLREVTMPRAAPGRGHRPAGQALERVLLRAATDGLVAATISQPLE